MDTSTSAADSDSDQELEDSTTVLSHSNVQDQRINRLCIDYERIVPYIKICKLFHLQSRMLDKDFRELFCVLAVSSDPEDRKNAQDVWQSCLIWRREGEKLLSLLKEDQIDINTIQEWKIWTESQLAYFCIICRGIEIAYRWIYPPSPSNSSSSSSSSSNTDVKKNTTVDENADEISEAAEIPFHYLYTELNKLSHGTIQTTMNKIQRDDQLEMIRWHDGLYGRHVAVHDRLQKNGNRLALDMNHDFSCFC